MVCCGKSGQKEKMPVVTKETIATVVGHIFTEILGAMAAGEVGPELGKHLCAGLDVDNPEIHTWLMDSVVKTPEQFSGAIIMYRLIETQLNAKGV